MSTPTRVHPGAPVVYPDCDGNPLSDNTLQFRWIVTLEGNFEAMFRDRPDVFVAGDLLWYPVEGDPTTRAAPDVLIAFGRPKGDRGSYRQWDEGGIAPQVVFEVLSPGNRKAEMDRKFLFYEKFGVEEYYIYDPDHFQLKGWHREGPRLKPAGNLAGRTSPRLGVRFELEPGRELVVVGPDGKPFRTFQEFAQERDDASRRAEAERLRAERLAAQLRALGIEPAE